MAEANVGSGTMAAKGVEVPTTNQNKLRYPESRGTPGHCADVVSLGYVVHHHVALYPHLRLAFVRELVTITSVSTERF